MLVHEDRLAPDTVRWRPEDQKERRSPENRQRKISGDCWGLFWKSPENHRRILRSEDHRRILGLVGEARQRLPAISLLRHLNGLQLLETRKLQRKSGDLCLIRAHLPQDAWPLFHFGPLPSFPSHRKCSHTSAVAIDQRPKRALQRRVPGSLLSSAGRW